MKKTSFSALGTGALVVLVVACGSFGEDEEQSPPPTTPADNSTPPPAPVDGKPIPGIYVSKSRGKPGASGLPDAPVDTLKEGFAIAKREGLRVIVCAEEYAETIELVDGVSAYGYYDCAVYPWVRGPKRAVVKSPTSPAMIGRDLKLPSRIEGFEIYAPDLGAAPAAGNEGTSIGMRIERALPKTLVISESLIKAGTGAPGLDGVDSKGATQSGTARGNDSGGQQYRSCPNPVTMNCTNPYLPGPVGPAPTCGDLPAAGPGGNGGDAVWWAYNGGAPEPGYNAKTDKRGRPFAATAQTAQGGAEQQRGSNGARGAEGADGTNGKWTIDLNGFTAGDGTQGEPGGPGQGGGGGGGNDGWVKDGVYTAAPPNAASALYWASSPGGSGGAGGCGGTPGEAGKGGGASISAFLVDASIELSKTRIESSTGGRAGKGTIGSGGNTGGAGGAGKDLSGSGGDGGRGGHAGVSGHGAAGPSIALVYKGIAPSRDGETMLVPGPGGAGQPEIREPIDNIKFIPAAPAGESKAEYVITTP